MSQPTSPQDPSPARYFFYGTLMDPDVLARVLGRAVGRERLLPAQLPGFRRFRARQGSYPILVPGAPEDVVDGLLASGLDEADGARLLAYEGPGYDLLAKEVTLKADGRRVEALVFLPNERLAPSEQDWDLARWQALDKADFWDSHFAMDNGRDIQLVSREVPFQGYFRVARYRLRHRLYAGAMGGVIQREVFERGHAVAVLPYDPVRDAVVLIEQFRSGAYAAGRPAWLVEAIAGMIKPGENGEEVARREAVEEANCHLLGPLEHLAGYFASPGGSDEHVDVYAGCCDCTGLGGVHGLPEEGEDIRVLVLGFDAAMARLAAGRIHASPPIIALFWLARERERLRREWTGRLAISQQRT
ncbi:MAG: gamma-glutamylcyclotransferase [Alphaproteobacteria bacterium]|nr:gamma-glutamylcyclotransferase [Alphaproteobacteria bacterium]